MGLINTLRTALDLAARVQEVERQCDGVLREWTDVLDKLKAREERERKRKRTALGVDTSADCADCGDKTSPTAVPGEKLELWHHMQRRATNGRAQ